MDILYMYTMRFYSAVKKNKNHEIFRKMKGTRDYI